MLCIRLHLSTFAQELKRENHDLKEEMVLCLTSKGE